MIVYPEPIARVGVLYAEFTRTESAQSFDALGDVLLYGGIDSLAKLRDFHASWMPCASLPDLELALTLAQLRRNRALPTLCKKGQKLS